MCGTAFLLDFYLEIYPECNRRGSAFTPGFGSYAASFLYSWNFWTFSEGKLCSWERSGVFVTHFQIIAWPPWVQSKRYFNETDVFWKGLWCSCGNGWHKSNDKDLTSIPSKTIIQQNGVKDWFYFRSCCSASPATQWRLGSVTLEVDNFVCFLKSYSKNK